MQCYDAKNFIILPRNLIYKTMRSKQPSDSVLYQHKRFDGERRCDDWLWKAYNAYARLYSFRMDRKLCRDYRLGKQYDKPMWVNGRQMSKREYMEKNGLPVIQFNLLGKNHRVILGQYRGNDVAPICKATDAAENDYAALWSELLRQNMKMNRCTEKDAKNFAEFLTGGLPVYKVSYADRNGRRDVFRDRVNPNMLLFPFTTDPDLADVGFIGMLHDFDFRRILSYFARSKADADKLRKIYTMCQSDEYLASTFSQDRRTSDMAHTDFFRPTEYGKCRVIELWTKEYREAWRVIDAREPNPYYVPYTAAEEAKLKAEREKRRNFNIMKDWDGVSPMMDELTGDVKYFEDPEKYESENSLSWEFCVEEYWYFRYMAPDGTILEEGVSPYWNGSESIQPFVVKGYPMDDGMIRSHAAEMIPAQDYLNYYIICMDFYIKNAAKGVMMVDEASISDMQSFEEMCDQFIRTNGVVVYTTKKGGKAPTIQTSQGIPGGFDYMINLSKSMSEDVSGAQASLQGKKESSSMSGVLMSQMINQAASSLSDMLGTYNDFLEQTAMKQIKIMKCCYTGRKKASICGKVLEEDMSILQDVDMELSISQNSNTPTYRALTSDFWLNLGVQGKIPLQAAVEAADLPDAQRVLAIIDKYQQTLQQQQQPGVIPPLAQVAAPPAA